MSEVLEDLPDERENADEVEQGYRKRLNNAVLRFGNIHNEDGRITIYLDGLCHTILMGLICYREKVVNRPDLTFKRLFHYAETGDGTYLTRFKYTNVSVH